MDLAIRWEMWFLHIESHSEWVREIERVAIHPDDVDRMHTQLDTNMFITVWVRRIPRRRVYEFWPEKVENNIQGWLLSISDTELRKKVQKRIKEMKNKVGREITTKTEFDKFLLNVKRTWNKKKKSST